MIVLADCVFTADSNNQGKYVGRCVQLPDLRTRPHKSRLDAIDDIVTQAAEKIRHLDGAIDDIRSGR